MRLFFSQPPSGDNFNESEIAADCKIIESTYGNRVHIFNGVVLRKSQIGNHVTLHAGVRLVKSVVGHHCYVSSEGVMRFAELGNYCSIGKDCCIGLPRHPTSQFVSTYPAFFAKNNFGCLESFILEKKFDDTPYPTKIGSDVWLGDNVLIPGGVSVGTGAVIAAGSVVVKDVPPFALVGGNPASLIRYRFEKDDIEFLTQIRWWDWTDEMVQDHAHFFQDIKLFRKVISSGKNHP